MQAVGGRDEEDVRGPKQSRNGKATTSPMPPPRRRISGRLQPAPAFVSWRRARTPEAQNSAMKFEMLLAEAARANTILPQGLAVMPAPALTH
uniref:Uncharacterized protein n=1 Tax=Caenorhabditis japonica TaxID=281687 RepID=A0A8R1IKF2_CAEJA